MDEMKPTELAYLIRQRKLEIGSRKGKRGETRGKTSKLIADELGMSAAKVELYDRLNGLGVHLAEDVNSGRLPITAAAHLASLSLEQQERIHIQLREAPGLRIDADYARVMAKASAGGGGLWFFIPDETYRDMQHRIKSLEELLKTFGDPAELRHLKRKEDNAARLREEASLHKRLSAMYHDFLKKNARVLSPEWEGYQYEAMRQTQLEKEASRKTVEAADLLFEAEKEKYGFVKAMERRRKRVRGLNVD